MDKRQVASLILVAELNNYVLTTHTTPVLIDGYAVFYTGRKV